MLNRIEPPPKRKAPPPGNSGSAIGYGTQQKIIDITAGGKRHSLVQRDLDWLIGSGVTTAAMIWPAPIMATTGEKVGDAFGFDPHATRWLVFEQPSGDVFWHPKTGELCSDFSQFCLGEQALEDPVSYAFDNSALSIFGSPLNWLRHSRQGIVIMRWELAFDLLRDVPRIVVDEEIVGVYRRAMRPARMPKVSVRRRAAA